MDHEGAMTGHLHPECVTQFLDFIFLRSLGSGLPVENKGVLLSGCSMVGLRVNSFIPLSCGSCPRFWDTKITNSRDLDFKMVLA